MVVALDTEITPALEREGWARDFVRAVQEARKDIGIDVTDHIVLHYATLGDDAARAIQEHRDYITTETLADDLVRLSMEDAEEKHKVLLGETAVWVNVVCRTR